MIGICGAHRTGKTTLAETFAELTGTHFVRTNASATFARLGMNPREDYDFPDRLAIQQEILLDMESAYCASPTPYFVTDRTPVDVAAYLMADIQRSTLSPVYEDDVQLLLARCRAVSAQHLSLLLMIQPGIRLVEAPGKAPASDGYIKHINYLMMGFLMGGGNNEYGANIAMLTPEIIGLRERVNVLHDLANTYLPEWYSLQENHSLN